MKYQSALTRVLASTFLIFAGYLAATAQPDSIFRLPAGTRIKLKLDAELNSKVSSLNDTFVASISQPVMVRETIVLPAGTQIEGRVAGVAPAGVGGRAGKMELVFETLRLSPEQSRRIDGVLVNKLIAPRNRSFDVLSILGGAAVGAVFGGIARSGSGAAVGAGIGGGIGTGIAFARKGRDVRLDRNTEFEIQLRKEVVLPVTDY